MAAFGQANGEPFLKAETEERHNGKQMGMLTTRGLLKVCVKYDLLILKPSGNGGKRNPELQSIGEYMPSFHKDDLEQKVFGITRETSAIR